MPKTQTLAFDEKKFAEVMQDADFGKYNKKKMTLFFKLFIDAALEKQNFFHKSRVCVIADSFIAKHANLLKSNTPNNKNRKDFLYNMATRLVKSNFLQSEHSLGHLYYTLTEQCRNFIIDLTYNYDQSSEAIIALNDSEKGQTNESSKLEENLETSAQVEINPRKRTLRSSFKKENPDKKQKKFFWDTLNRTTYYLSLNKFDKFLITKFGLDPAANFNLQGFLAIYKLIIAAAFASDEQRVAIAQIQEQISSIQMNYLLEDTLQEIIDKTTGYLIIRQGYCQVSTDLFAEIRQNADSYHSTIYSKFLSYGADEDAVILTISDLCDIYKTHCCPDKAAIDDVIDQRILAKLTRFITDLYLYNQQKAIDVTQRYLRKNCLALYDKLFCNEELEMHYQQMLYLDSEAKDCLTRIMRIKASPSQSSLWPS